MTWVLLTTVLLAAGHLFGARVGRRLDIAEHSAHSFGGGMAIAYVFLHLLPELEKGDQVLGHSIHLVALAGFVGFYATEHWIVRHGEARAWAFRLRIGLHAIYNWLVIYALPEAVDKGLGYALLLSAALGLHLLSTDYTLRSRYAVEFESWGRWALAAALVAGWVTDLFYEPVNPLVADTWTALLAGFVLCNVFREETPDYRTARFGWFLAGVIVYAVPSLFLGVGA